MRFRTFHGRTPAPMAIAIAVAMFLGACSKSEPETKPSRGVITAPAPPSAPPAPVAQPIEKGDAAAGASGYAPGEALKERLARQEAASKLMVAPTPAPPPRAPEVKPAAGAPASAMRVVTRVEPEFPSEAVKAGVYEGTVQARLIVDANGSVTRVEIVEARPRRVFDRAVVRALSEWKYNEGAAGRTVTVELAFKAR